MSFAIEIVSSDDLKRLIDRFVLEQDRAEHGLLGLDILRGTRLRTSSVCAATTSSPLPDTARVFHFARARSYLDHRSLYPSHNPNEGCISSSSPQDIHMSHFHAKAEFAK